MAKSWKKELQIAVVDDAQVDTPTKPQIPFSHWFASKVKQGKLKHYQDEALLVFFSKKGLKDLEDEDTYNKALEKF